MKTAVVLASVAFQMRPGSPKERLAENLRKQRLKPFRRSPGVLLILCISERKKGWVDNGVDSVESEFRVCGTAGFPPAPNTGGLSPHPYHTSTKARASVFLVLALCVYRLN